MPAGIGYDSDPGSVLRVFPSGRPDRATRPSQTKGVAPLNPGLSTEANARVAGGNRTIIPGSGRMPGEMSPMVRQVLGDPRGRPSTRPSVSRSNPELLERVMAERSGRSSGASSGAAAPSRGRGRRRGLGINMDGFGATSGVRTRADDIRSNVRRSREGRTGGFRRSGVGAGTGISTAADIVDGPMYGPTRADIVAPSRGRGRRRGLGINMEGFGKTSGVRTRADDIRSNVRRSREGRTGGFRRSGVGAGGTVSTAADIAEGAIHGPGKAELEAIKRTGQTNTKQPIMKGMKNKKGLLVAGGAAVIAGLAYSGRRGEGSSGGRTSQYRY